MKIRITPQVVVGDRAPQVAVFPGVDSPQAADNHVFVLAHGVVSGTNGSRAAAVVAQAMGTATSHYLQSGTAFSSNEIYQACDSAHAALVAAREQSGSGANAMTTSMATLAISEQGVLATHLGNARLYHVRTSTGEILYRSKDHTLVNYLFQLGRLSRDEVRLSPKRNILARALQAQSGTPCDPDVAIITDVLPGDCFVMLNSRVADVMSDKQLLELLSQESNDTDFAALRSLSNAALIVVKVNDVEHTADEALLVPNEQELTDPIVACAMMPLADITPAAAAEQAPQDNQNTAPEPLAEPAEATDALPPESADSEQPAPAAVPPAKPKKDYKTLKRVGLILLAGIAFASIITAVFMLRSAGKDTEKKAADTTVNTDVRVDSLLPEMPGDSLPTGTDVPVPAAPSAGNIDLPTPASSSKGSYATGSAVHVPRATNHDYSSDDFGTPRNYSIDESKVSDDNDENYYQPDKWQRRQVQPEPQPENTPSEARQSVPSPASSSSQSTYDPARSNNRSAVPPPPSKRNKQPAVYP